MGETAGGSVLKYASLLPDMQRGQGRFAAVFFLTAQVLERFRISSEMILKPWRGRCALCMMPYFSSSSLFSSSKKVLMSLNCR